jgi:hypothetical protein
LFFTSGLSPHSFDLPCEIVDFVFDGFEEPSNTGPTVVLIA